MRLRVLISLNACVASQLGTTPALRLNSGSARSMVSGAGGLESRVMVLGYRSGKGFAVWKDPAYVQRSSSRFATAPPRKLAPLCQRPPESSWAVAVAL